MEPPRGVWGIIGRAIDQLWLFKQVLAGRSIHHTWQIVGRAKQRLLELESDKGISIHEVDIVASFESWDDGMGVWVFFPTDEDLKRHSGDGTTEAIERDFRNLLKELKYPFRRFPRLGFVFDSDENVQKNYEGSYFYRLR